MKVRSRNALGAIRPTWGMAIADRNWRFITEEGHPGAMNMALDATAADTAANGGPRTIRLYRWQPSTLSLGYGQPADTVDWSFCRDAGIDVTRRPTGGGGIYHDVVGDISYSIAAPAAELPGDLMETYDRLLTPVLDALKSMGVDAGLAEAAKPPLHEPACYLRAVNPAHDVVVDGRKLSGNAQYRRKDAVIQHGSITYSRVVDRHLGVFAEPGVDEAGFRDRVTSIRNEVGIAREEAIGALEAAFREWAAPTDGTWSDEELAAATTKVDDRFGADGWIRRC